MLAESQEDEENADAAEDAGAAGGLRVAGGSGRRELRAHAGGAVRAGPASGTRWPRTTPPPASSPTCCASAPRKLMRAIWGEYLERPARRGDRRRRRAGPRRARGAGGGEGLSVPKASGKAKAAKPLSRMAPHARGDDGRGGRRPQTGGGRGGRGGRARSACQPRGGPRRRRLSRRARRRRGRRERARARGIPTRARGGGSRDGGRGEGGPQAAPSASGPARPPSPAAKKEENWESRHRLRRRRLRRRRAHHRRLSGGRPLWSRTWTTMKTSTSMRIWRRAACTWPSRRTEARAAASRPSFVVTYDLDAAVHPRDRDAQGVAAGRAHARVLFGARHLAGGAAAACPPCGTRPRRSTR